MLNPDSPMPLYRQLADLLAEGIRRGAYPAGSRLPAETRLAADHRLGRPTVRQALDVLVRAGLVERRRGAGTFVRPPREEVDLFSLAGTLSVPEGQNGVGILVQYATGDVLVEGNNVTGSATDAGAWLYQNNFPLQPVVLRGNRFVSSSPGSAAPGQGVGVLVTDDPALFGESGSGPSYALLESNDVSGGVRGVRHAVRTRART